jgi:hypothetical protein
MMRFGRPRLIGIIAVLSMAFLGVIYPLLTATKVVETVTETVVQPSRTITTVAVLEGGDVMIRIESPRVKVIAYYERQDQICVVRFTAVPEPEQSRVIAFPGTTAIAADVIVTVPGVTATYVLTEPAEVAATVPLRTAFTTTEYTALNVTRTLTIGMYVTAVATLAFVHGIIEEACSLAYEVSRSRMEPERLPATVVVAFPGATYTVPGTTYIVPGYTYTRPEPIVPPELADLKTTLTVTKRGTTRAETAYMEPTTVTLTIQARSNVTTTVVLGATYVRTYLVTRAFIEPGAAVTGAVIVVAAAAFAVGILLGFRRGRR